MRYQDQDVLAGRNLEQTGAQEWTTVEIECFLYAFRYKLPDMLLAVSPANLAFVDEVENRFGRCRCP